MLEKLSLTVRRGASEDIPIRVESDVLVYVDITGIAASAPISITAPAHGLTDGWRAAVMNSGVPEIDTNWDDPLDDALRRITWIDADTIEFNDVNGISFTPYTAGGQLVYREPLDLSQFVEARMNVKASVTGPILATYKHTTGELLIDMVTKALRLTLDTTDTSALTAGKRVFDIEMVRADGSVFPICSAKSALTVLPEITTSA
jgi:hypothetical protein